MNLRAASQQKQLHPLREGMSWKDKMRAELMLINQHLNQQKSQDFVPTAKAQDTIGELAHSYKTICFGTRPSHAGCQGLVLRLVTPLFMCIYLLFLPPNPFPLLAPSPGRQFMNILANIHDRVHWP